MIDLRVQALGEKHIRIRASAGPGGCFANYPRS